MISFKEFLTSQEDRLLAERSAHERARAKWVVAVADLISRIEGWIKTSDPHSLVKLDTRMTGDVDELGFLRKEFDPLGILDISLGNRTVSIRPVARDVLGPHWNPGVGRWAGRVDMMVVGEPNRYEMFRFVFGDDREDWYLRNSRTYEINLLDHEEFDAALVDLFS